MACGISGLFTAQYLTASWSWCPAVGYVLTNTYETTKPTRGGACRKNSAPPMRTWRLCSARVLGGIPSPSRKKHQVMQRPEKRPIAVLLDRIRDLLLPRPTMKFAYAQSRSYYSLRLLEARAVCLPSEKAEVFRSDSAFGLSIARSPKPSSTVRKK